MGRLDAAARQLAATQHGVVTRAELRTLGFSDDQIDWRVTVGELMAVHQSVYVLAGVPLSPEQTLLAAVCAAGPGAIASHRSAAWLWGLPGGLPEPPEVSATGRRRREPDGVRSHERFALSDIDISVRRGIPVTSPARTLLDLGAVVPFPLFEAAAEQALLTGLTSITRLRDVRERVGGRGRPGSAAVRAFLEERGADEAPAESRLEVELLQLLRLHGLPKPKRQHELVLPGYGRCRLDLAYPDIRLGIEADGRRWHSGTEDFQRDRARGNALKLVSWQVLQFTWADVRERPEQVANTVRQALTLRRFAS